MFISGASNNAGVQINPNSNQPDYSAQWVEYYRSIGMFKEAAVIEEQAKAKVKYPIIIVLCVFSPLLIKIKSIF